MLFNTSNSSNTIDFLGIQVSISSFLLIAGGFALLVFLFLLVILFLMYLRKKMAIKGYLSFEKKEHQLDVEILELETEILEIQKKFYINKQTKKKSKKL